MLFMGRARLARSMGINVSEYDEEPLKGMLWIVWVEIAGGTDEMPQSTNCS